MKETTPETQITERTIKGWEVGQLVTGLKNTQQNWSRGERVSVYRDKHTGIGLFPYENLFLEDEKLVTPDEVVDREVSIDLVTLRDVGKPPARRFYWLSGKGFSNLLAFSEAALSWEDGIQLTFDFESKSLQASRVCEHSTQCPPYRATPPEI